MEFLLVCCSATSSVFGDHAQVCVAKEYLMLCKTLEESCRIGLKLFSLASYFVSLAGL